MFVPRTCPLCHRPGPSPCEACARELEPAPSLTAPLDVDRCDAVLAYEGAGRDLVARLKYGNARSTLRWLAVHMASLAPRDVDVVTWLPTSDARRRSRGFDQAELLARSVARALHKPCRRLLVRAPGPAQTGRSITERRAGPPLTVKTRVGVPAHVLLVDDVVTSGTSVTVAARGLRAAGARRVSVVAAARTPLKRAHLDPENLET